MKNLYWEKEQEVKYWQMKRAIGTGAVVSLMGRGIIQWVKIKTVRQQAVAAKLIQDVTEQQLLQLSAAADVLQHGKAVAR